MKEIREWLAGQQDYARGVALYETHGRSQVVLKSLRFGQTDFTRATLRRELEKLLGEKVASSPKKVASSPASGAEMLASSSQKVASSPATVPSSAEQQRPTWYATRAYLHAQLELVGTDGERRDLAGDILGLVDKIGASYRPAAEPAPPPAAAALPTDAGEQRRQLANLRAQVSKLKKNPARATDLARAQATITQLEVKLKTRDGESQLHPSH